MNAVDLLDPHARRAIRELLELMIGSERMHAPGRAAGPGEAAALRAVDVALGLVEPPSRREELLLSRLNERDRALAFATCAWLMLADGVPARGESRFLVWLADQLRLSDARVRALWAHARRVRARSRGSEPLHREVDALLTGAARRYTFAEARSAA